MENLVNNFRKITRECLVNLNVGITLQKFELF